MIDLIWWWEWDCHSYRVFSLFIAVLFGSWKNLLDFDFLRKNEKGDHAQLLIFVVESNDGFHTVVMIFKIIIA